MCTNFTDWIFVHCPAVSLPECRIYPFSFTGGLCCGRGKGPSGHSVDADRTPLSFSYMLTESLNVVVQYSARTDRVPIFGVYDLPVK